MVGIYITEVNDFVSVVTEVRRHSGHWTTLQELDLDFNSDFEQTFKPVF